MSWEKYTQLLKEELESRLGGIVSLKDKSINGDIDKVLADFCAEYTEDQWRTILEGKYEALFDGALPAYSRIANALEFFSERKDCSAMIELVSDSIVETMIDYKTIRWYHLKKNDVYIKVSAYLNLVMHDKVLGYEIEVVKKEMVPERHDHIAVMLFVDNNGYVLVQDQMTGTESECIKWMNSKKETIRNSDDQYVLKLIKRRNH